MNPLRPLARRLARTAYARRAVAERADLSAFRARPSARLAAGVLLIVLGQLMGMPAVAAFGLIAAHTRRPIMLLAAPASYIASWGVWSLGMWLAGPDNIRYLGVLLRWTVRRFVEYALGQEPDAGAEATSPEEPS